MDMETYQAFLAGLGRGQPELVAIYNEARAAGEPWAEAVFADAQYLKQPWATNEDGQGFAVAALEPEGPPPDTAHIASVIGGVRDGEEWAQKQFFEDFTDGQAYAIAALPKLYEAGNEWATDIVDCYVAGEAVAEAVEEEGGTFDADHFEQVWQDAKRSGRDGADAITGYLAGYKLEQEPEQTVAVKGVESSGGEMGQHKYSKAHDDFGYDKAFAEWHQERKAAAATVEVPPAHGEADQPDEPESATDRALAGVADELFS